MCKILTEDILKFEVNKSKTQEFDMKHIPPQILSLLIVRCPVSPDVNKMVYTPFVYVLVNYVEFSKSIIAILKLCNLRGGWLKAHLRVFALTHLILELHYCSLVIFLKKNSFTRYDETNFLIGSQDLA